jgi:hypothetical protein
VNDVPWTKLGNNYATAPTIISEVHRADTASHSASMSVAFIVLVDFNVASTIHGSLLLHGLSTIDTWQTHGRNIRIERFRVDRLSDLSSTFK